MPWWFWIIVPMIVLCSTTVNLATEPWLVTLLQHHIKTIFANTSDSELVSNLNHPFVTRGKCFWWALATALVGSIDLNGNGINSYKKCSYYYIIMVLLLHNENQCSKRIILSFMSVAVSGINIWNIILYQMLETNFIDWKHAVWRWRKGQVRNQIHLRGKYNGNILNRKRTIIVEITAVNLYCNQNWAFYSLCIFGSKII